MVVVAVVGMARKSMKVDMAENTMVVNKAVSKVAGKKAATAKNADSKVVMVKNEDKKVVTVRNADNKVVTAVEECKREDMGEEVDNKVDMVKSADKKAAMEEEDKNMEVEDKNMAEGANLLDSMEVDNNPAMVAVVEDKKNNLTVVDLAEMTKAGMVVNLEALDSIRMKSCNTLADTRIPTCFPKQWAISTTTRTK